MHQFILFNKHIQISIGILSWVIRIFESNFLEFCFLIILSWEKRLHTSFTETRLRFKFILFADKFIFAFNISIFTFCSCLLTLSCCLLLRLIFFNLFKGSFFSLSSTFSLALVFKLTILNLTRLRCGSTGLLSFLTSCLFFLENFTSLHDLLFSYLYLFLSNSYRLSILCLLDLLFGGFNWLSFFINDGITLMIFKFTFTVHHNNWSSLLLLFNNFRSFNDLLFCYFNLFLSCLNGLTIFC